MEFYPEASHPNYVISLGGIPHCSFAAFTSVKHKISVLGNIWLLKALTENQLRALLFMGLWRHSYDGCFMEMICSRSAQCLWDACKLFACVSKYVHACTHSWRGSGLGQERADVVCALWLQLRSSVQLPRGQDALGVCYICQACRDKLPRLNCSFPSTQVVFTPSSPQ